MDGVTTVEPDGAAAPPATGCVVKGLNTVNSGWLLFPLPVPLPVLLLLTEDGETDDNDDVNALGTNTPFFAVSDCWEVSQVMVLEGAPLLVAAPPFVANTAEYVKKNVRDVPPAAPDDDAALAAEDEGLS